MKTTIKASVPLVQKVKVTSTYYKEWDTHLIGIVSEEHYPTHPDRKPLADELTLCFDSQVEVEKFIALIRKATRKIK